MSKFIVVKEQFKDKECLLNALKELGFKEIEDCPEARTLYGYRGDQREEKAHIIIRRKHVGRLSNDIGFVKTASGYDMIVSEYDQPDSRLHNLSQTYGLMKMKKEIKMKGYSLVSQNKDNKNRIKLRIRIP